MPDRRIPPGPQSATLVGMGAVEYREPVPREEVTTPPLGSTFDHGAPASGDPLRAGDVSLLIGEVRRLEGKQDAAIDDVRKLAQSVREFLEAQKARDAARDEAVFGLLALPGDVGKLAGRVGDLVDAVRALDARIGRPPSAEDFARASHADATHEELARLEEDARLGTGLWRFVMDLHLRSSRAAARAAGLSGSGGAVVGAVVVELARLIAGG